MRQRAPLLLTGTSKSVPTIGVADELILIRREGERMAAMRGDEREIATRTREPATISRGLRTMASSSLGVLALGQLLSVLVTGTGICSTILASRGMSFPMLQSTLTYVVLSLQLVASARRRTAERWWKYALIAVVDFEANFLLILAYRYTSIASVMLLDCATIPCIMLLSRAVLKARYTRKHALGVCLCIVGLACAIASDWFCLQRGGEASPDAVLGDALTLCGAALYAVSNVCQELLVKQHGRDEFLGYVGLFGGLLGLLQTGLLEGAQLRAAVWEPAALGLLGGFTAFLVAFYHLTSLFMQRADAALFTLSLLTSDVYAVAFAALAERQRFCALYGVGFALTIGGVVIFTREHPPTPCARDVARVPLALTAPLGASEHCCSVAGAAPATAQRLAEADDDVSLSAADEIRIARS